MESLKWCLLISWEGVTLGDMRVKGSKRDVLGMYLRSRADPSVGGGGPPNGSGLDRRAYCWVPFPIYEGTSQETILGWEGQRWNDCAISRFVLCWWLAGAADDLE